MNEWIETFMKDDSCVLRMKARLHYAGVPGQQGADIINSVIRKRSQQPKSVDSTMDALMDQFPGVW